MSKNEVTIRHIEIAVSCMQKLLAEGMTVNLAIRHLEKLVDVYAKYRAVGKVSVDHVDEFSLWSIAARQAKKQNPNRKAGEYLRVEHGTPRRKFALQILKNHKEGKLNKTSLDRHCEKLWKVAVITHDEDSELNKIKKIDFDIPAERWAYVGIKFPKVSKRSKRVSR